jgi:peroxiredoxin Q/BCP
MPYCLRGIVAACVLAALMTMPGLATAEPLAEGKPAPDFALPDQNNKTHKLSKLRGRTVVLAFYPVDMTRGCTLEARSFTAARQEFAKRRAVVFSISVQDVASKRKFCDAEGLKHTLLADVDGKVASTYGVLGPSGVAQRVTFIVNPKGEITNVIDHVDVQNSARQVLELIPEKKKGSARRT